MGTCFGPGRAKRRLMTKSVIWKDKTYLGHGCHVITPLQESKLTTDLGRCWALRCTHGTTAFYSGPQLRPRRLLRDTLRLDTYTITYGGWSKSWVLFSQHDPVVPDGAGGGGGNTAPSPRSLPEAMHARGPAAPVHSVVQRLLSWGRAWLRCSFWFA